MGNSSEKSTKGNNDNKQPEKQQSQKLKETQSTPQSFKCFFDKYSENSQLDISQFPNIDSSLSQALKTFANSLFNTNNLTLQQYLELSEILTQAPSYQSKLLPKMRPIEIQCRLMGYSENDTIPNEECSKLLFVLFQMILCGDACKFLMNRIYEDSLEQSQRVGYVCNKINTLMPIVNEYILAFWTNIFSENSITSRIQRPILSQNSKIINNEILTILSTQVQFGREFTQLYNNQNSGTSFNRLAWNVLGYGGPTLILIQIDKKCNQLPIIFGAYNPNPWSDGLKYQSDSGCFLISFSPSFRMFSSTGNDNCYAYLNTKNIDRSKYKVGLGFGGNSEHTSFRLWIDDEIENKSKVSSEDDTYQPGYLAGEIEGKINILYIEVWGLGGKQALILQEKYRQERLEELERMRKVDKKQFFSGFDQAMFFEKTFAHRDQVREEISKE